MSARSRPDVLIVSLGSTAGLRAADDELADTLQSAGARVGPEPRAVIYSTTTAALLWRRPGAIRFDAPALANRPGRHGLWQRPLERRRLQQAPLLLPLSAGGLAEARLSPEARERAVVLPLPVAASAPSQGAERRDVAALTYAGNPAKKGLDRVLAAWRDVRAGAARAEAAAGAELLVAGASDAELRSAGIDLSREPGVRSVGRLPREQYRLLLRRARVFVCAPRREDYGQAQLEALADGCLLVTTPAPGPYAALPIARELDARLVGEDLAAALAAALALDAEQAAAYARRAAAALQPLSPAAIERRVADELLPRLLR